MAALFTFTVKSAPEHREDMLRTLRFMLQRRGVANPNVGPDSDFYAIATMLANQLAVTGANNVIKADELLPDTAEDDLEEGSEALSRWLRIVGLGGFRPASGSIGYIDLDTSAPTTVTIGQQLVDPLGQRYEVLVGGSNLADGTPVAIQALTAGRATNLPAGTALKWQSAPAYSAPVATVSEGGLTNGTDTETNEEARERLFQYLRNPPASGNWSHVALEAEKSSTRVQKAFVFPAVQGGSTFHVAVTASPTDSNKSRQINALLMSGTVAPYIIGKFPEHVAMTITTVADTPVDVAFGLTLPEARTASPPGPGGGWKNATPWPAPNNVSTFRAQVAAVTTTTAFSVTADTAPVAGVTRIAWLSPTTWRLFQGLVTSVGAPVGGAYPITVDVPFTDIGIGSYIWPDCDQAQALVDSALASFALMGPGEKTANPSALQRGFRHPRPQASYPYALGPNLTGDLDDVDGVAVAQFMFRTDSTVTSTIASGLLVPQPPAVITDPPRQYVPRHLAFYRLP